MWSSLRNRLQQRLQNLGGAPVSKRLDAHESATVTPFTPKPLPPKIGVMGDRAAEAVESLSADLNNWFEIDFNTLLVAWDRVVAQPQSSEIIGEFFRACHNLAGSESLYGKPEISRLCRSLVNLLNRGKLRTDHELIALHIDACRAVISSTGTQSDVQLVCETLESEVAKLLAA